MLQKIKENLEISLEKLAIYKKSTPNVQDEAFLREKLLEIRSTLHAEGFLNFEKYAYLVSMKKSLYEEKFKESFEYVF